MLDVSTFAYNFEAPFELSVLSQRIKDGVSIQDVCFKSPLSGKVSAYLIVPSEPRPQAGLIIRARENTPPEAWEAMLVAESPYDACHYIGQAAPSSLFFQFARHDDFVSVQDAEHYFELASEPKRIAWYEDCNHELGAQARIDRAIFLCEQLGLPSPSQ